MDNAIAEESRLIKPANRTVIQLVQITDCHILAAADDCLRGVNTRQSFAAVSAAVRGDNNKLDLILATGDLSQDGAATAYEYLAGQFDELAVPSFWLPGNHDDLGTLREHFRGKWINASKQVLIGDWQIVLLDSTIEGEVHGRVSAAQLEFLDHALKAYPDRYALVCLHHQALDSGSEWLDLKGLENSAQLREQITQHECVRGVLWGHVHQEAQHQFSGIEWMSTPSSSVQFKPDSKEFSIGSEVPGYRRLSLYPDGTLTTVVHRVNLDE